MTKDKKKTKKKEVKVKQFIGKRKVPRDYLEGSLKYINSLKAEGGDLELFLTLIGAYKNEGVMVLEKEDSSKIYLVNGKNPIIIDSYLGRTASTANRPFRRKWGGVIAALNQSGYSFEKMKVFRDPKIVDHNKKLDDIEKKLVY